MTDRQKMYKTVKEAEKEAHGLCGSFKKCDECPYCDHEECFLALLLDCVIERVTKSFDLVKKGENHEN